MFFCFNFFHHEKSGYQKSFGGRNILQFPGIFEKTQIFFTLFSFLNYVTFFVNIFKIKCPNFQSFVFSRSVFVTELMVR